VTSESAIDMMALMPTRHFSKAHDKADRTSVGTELS
jgi:hypothetical protein